MIIAVGGRAGRLPIPVAELGLTYSDVRSVTALPERVCVIGAADTGCQLTSILADFGCDVTLIEYAPRIVLRADVDVSVALEHAFRGRGIEVITSAAVHQLEALKPGVRILYRVGDESRVVDVDAAFFAVVLEGGQEGVVDVDDPAREALDEVAGQHLHVAGEHDQVDRAPPRAARARAASCSAFFSRVIGNTSNGTPNCSATGARSGWLLTTSAISHGSSPARWRSSRSYRQWS